MIDPTQRLQLIRLRLEQAHETVRSTEHLVEIGDYRTALNRIYYGMFYAVLALALLENFETSKHGQLQGWFNKNFVKTGILEPVLFEMLRIAFDRRNDADYELKPLPQPADLAQMLENMRYFVSRIESYVDDQHRQG